jgi:hypothetical protein
MSDPRLCSDEIAERGEAIYDRDIRDSLDASDQGKFLVLDVDSGDYELDVDEIAAAQEPAGRRHAATCRKNEGAAS